MILKNSKSKKMVSYGYSRSTSELHTEKHIFAFICGGTEYNNLQPKLLKAGSITFFFMLQETEQGQEGLEVKFSI